MKGTHTGSLTLGTTSKQIRANVCSKTCPENMQVSIKDTKLKNLGTSEHAGNKYVEYATHFSLILDKEKTQKAVGGTQWQPTDKLLFSLLDQTMEPQDNTPIELQYDTHHMGDIGVDFLRKYVENYQLLHQNQRTFQNSYDYTN